MLVIRLQRLGKKKRPTYRVIVSEKTKDTQAGSLEILGQYNPQEQPKVVNLKADRIKHWIAQGAQPSETVHNLLVNEGIIEGKKQKSVVISKKREAKMDEKNKAKEEAAEASKTTEAEEKSTEPVEEVKEEPKEEKLSEEVKEEVPATEEKPAEENKPEVAEEKPTEEKSAEEVKKEKTKEKKEK